MSSSWGIPSVEEEAELHRSRLLNVEERPFKRIVKRLIGINSLVQERVRQQLTPPPEGASNSDAPRPATANGDDERRAKHEQELTLMKEEINMDFSAFDVSIARIQLLMNANVRERERYAADKGRIVAEAQTVRDNTAELRVRLEHAKATLAQRRKFDELADRITSSKILRPRDEQHASLKKLEEECEGLERESESYGVTWMERREQFNKIVEEGMQLRRLIRDEKDDFDRREGMEDGEEDGETGSHGNASPNPEAVAAKLESRARTPSRVRSSPVRDGAEALKPLPNKLGETWRSGSRAPSRDVSPGRGDPGEIEEGEDVEMDDSASQKNGTSNGAWNGNETPRITLNGPRGDSREEGRDDDNREDGREKMDTE